MLIFCLWLLDASCCTIFQFIILDSRSVTYLETYTSFLSVPFVSFPGGCMALGTPAMQWDLCWRPSWARHSALSSEDSMPGNNPRRLYTLCFFFGGAYVQTYTNHNVLDHVGQVLLSRYSIWFIINIQHFQSSALSKLFGSSALHQ